MYSKLTSKTALEPRGTDGIKYEGEFKANLFEGHGRLTDWEGKVIYEGEFKDGKPRENIMVHDTYISNIMSAN